MNNVNLTGRLTKDLILRKTPNGTSTVSFTVASPRRTKQQGQPDADFINCVAWGTMADNMVKYLKKGSQIGVEGRIQTRSYDDKNGKKIYVTEVIASHVEFLESKPRENINTLPPMSYTSETEEGYENYLQDVEVETY